MTELQSCERGGHELVLKRSPTEQERATYVCCVSAERTSWFQLFVSVTKCSTKGVP